MDKVELRKLLLKTRQSMTAEEWQNKSLQICENLQASTMFADARTVLAYFSIRQEPNLSALFPLNKEWGFPRCVDKNLTWYCWSPPSSLPLQKGAYGILEPHPDSPLLNVDAVDVLLVPAIACDKQGYRLGYGGGFYDRLLTQPEWRHKPTIGVVFNFAYLPQLPYDSWDRSLYAVCTESGFFPVERD